MAARMANAVLSPTGRDAAAGGVLMHRFPLMGGEGELHLVAGSPDRLANAAEAAEAAEAAVAEARRIERLWSRYRPDSIVSKINAAAGTAEPVPVDPETAAMLDFAARLHGLSGGRFDLTSGVLRHAWDFRRAVRPERAHLRALLERVGWSRVQWDGGAIRLPEPGMELDFGGIGKEYAADRCATLLAERGVVGGWINLGGDVRVLGPQADGRPWRLGIRHPRRSGEVFASVSLARGALATSGDYERFVEIDGQRLCHILDPRTGWPVSHWQSVSVMAPVCTAAGACATIAMLMGEEAPGWLDAQGVRWLAVDASGKVHGDASNEGPWG